MDLSIFSQCVDELYKYGIEVWTYFDPDPNIVRIKVKKKVMCGLKTASNILASIVNTCFFECSQNS